MWARIEIAKDTRRSLFAGTHPEWTGRLVSDFDESYGVLFLTYTRSAALSKARAWSRRLGGIPVTDALDEG